jgi:hypothetical protein
MFYYIHEWYKWFNSWRNGMKEDELPAQEITDNKPNSIPDEIPFEDPISPLPPKQKLHGTGWKY